MFNRDKKNDNLDDGFDDEELSFDEDYGSYDDLDYISPIYIVLCLQRMLSIRLFIVWISVLSVLLHYHFLP